MRRELAVSLLLGLLSGCALFRPAPRPARAPPEEAAQYRFPVALPTEGQFVLPGPISTALALAMEDFLPLGAKPPRNATPSEVCAFQRESYDVTAVPGQDGVVFVSFAFRETACHDLPGPRPSEVPTLYAVDTRQWRILSVQK